MEDLDRNGYISVFEAYQSTKMEIGPPNNPKIIDLDNLSNKIYFLEKSMDSNWTNIHSTDENPLVFIHLL